MHGVIEKEWLVYDAPDQNSDGLAQTLINHVTVLSVCVRLDDLNCLDDCWRRICAYEFQSVHYIFSGPFGLTG